MAYSEVIPYLYYEDADAAIDWLERVLGFGPTTRWRMGGAATREADVLVGASRVSISGRAPGAEEGRGALVIVHVDDVAALHARILAADPGVPVPPPERQPYGPTMFTVVDPWGYRWNFWQGEADPPEADPPEPDRPADAPPEADPPEPDRPADAPPEADPPAAADGPEA